MCLAANLPWDMSDYLIQRSGHQLLCNNDDHNWYRFVLKHMYPKTIPEIQAFLQEQGASPLLKLQHKTEKHGNLVTMLKII